MLYLSFNDSGLDQAFPRIEMSNEVISFFLLEALARKQNSMGKV